MITRFFFLPASAILVAVLIGCDEGPRAASGSSLLAQEPPQAVPVFRNPAPPDDVLQLDPEPLLAIGGTHATDDSHVLHDVTGAKRLNDGSVIVAVSGNHQIRRFDSRGQLLWQVGREGAGPGEFQRLHLLRGCSTADTVITYDRYLRRLTVFDGEGTLVDTHRLEFGDAGAYTLTCSPSGRLAMSGWGDLRAEGIGPFRWTVALGYADIGSRTVNLLREGVPGQDRVQYPSSNGPRTWGRRAVVGATDQGIWLGTGDSYELEFLNWRGQTLKKIRWGGPDLVVTEDHIASYREARYSAVAQSEDPNARPAFERWWSRERGYLPERFPALSGILVLSDGSFWLERYPAPGKSEDLWFFDVYGRWTRTLRLPPRTSVLDAGTSWVVVLATDDLDVQSVRVHRLVPVT